LLQGKFEELQPAKRLVFSWRFNNWEDGCFSKVRQVMGCCAELQMLLSTHLANLTVKRGAYITLCMRNLHARSCQPGACIA
jgi:uncharacterized protein YndB with AHSA1/START domain